MLLRRGLFAVVTGALVGATVLVPSHIGAAPAVAQQPAVLCVGVDACDADADGFSAPEDCNDADDTIFPGATEIWADGIDQDCDGKEICYYDGDEDGARHPDGSIMSIDTDCTDRREAMASAPVDCDDENPAVREVCEGDEPTTSGGGESGGGIPTAGADSGTSIPLASALLLGGTLVLFLTRRRPARS